MIRADETRLFPISRCQDRGMVRAYIVESMNHSIIISTDHKFYIPKPAVHQCFNFLTSHEESKCYLPPGEKVTTLFNLIRVS